ncbi:MAG: hypothetical protein Q9M36_09630 [Sulfurovum sp.]|nr:hypothetical protein [Sulfurovum sp.]
MTPDTALTAYGDFSVELEILVNNIPIGRTKTIIVSLVKKVTLVSGELGIQGGKIENEWKDIRISVDANKLNQTYEIEYNAGLTNDGRLSLWFNITPDMNRTEMSELNILQPSYELIKRNYFTPNQTTRQTRTLKVERPMNIPFGLHKVFHQNVDQVS